MFVSLQDRAGNDRSVYWDKLQRRGLPSLLNVTSRRIDRDKPQITELTASPTAVDLTAGNRSVPVTVHAGDQVSGVVTPRLQGFRPMHRIAGDRHRGVWRASTTIDACSTGTRTMRLPVSVSDRAGNHVQAPTTVSVINHNDIRPPVPRSVSPDLAGPTDPVTFRFTEDVVGIAGLGAGPHHLSRLRVREWRPASLGAGRLVVRLRPAQQSTARQGRYEPPRGLPEHR